MYASVKRALTFCLLAVFLVSSALLVKKIQDKSYGAESYEQARQLLTERISPTEDVPETMSEKQLLSTEILAELATMKPVWVPMSVEDDPYMEELSAVTLDDLQQINPDVMGWILIPDSTVDYPLLQSDDNSYYLDHTWDLKENSVGAIFMDYRNSSDLSDHNTILYGHNLTNGSMFSSLKSYSDPEYWKIHPYIYITDGSTVYRYEVFSCYRAGLQDPTYSLSFLETMEKEVFLTHALEKSKIQTNILPVQTDRILTLSTCVGDGSNTRWVVQARLKMVQIQVPA